MILTQEERARIAQAIASGKRGAAIARAAGIALDRFLASYAAEISG